MKLLALLVTLAIATTAHGFQEPLRAADIPVLEPPVVQTVEVRVEVQRLSGDFASSPVAAEVSLHVLEPPHELVRSLSATAGDDGIVVFELEPREGLQAFAEVDVGRRFFGDAVDVSTPGERSSIVSVYDETNDPSVVVASSVTTIVELWEDYITFTQVFTFLPSEAVIYASDRENPATFIRVEVPENAEGIRVVRPEDDTRVVGNEVAFAGEVAPPGATDHRGPHLIIQYSLPSENRSTVEWEQRLSMDFQRMSIVIPQGSTFARHPAFDVSFDVPMCGDGAAATSICFDEITDDPQGIPLREDVDVLVARASGRRDQVLRVSTTGWPAPARWKTPTAIGFASLMVLFFGFLAVRDRAGRSGDALASQLASLRAQREALLASAAEVEKRFDDGLMIERDAAIARRRIREQLGVVYRRLRETEAGASPE